MDRGKWSTPVIILFSILGNALAFSTAFFILVCASLMNVATGTECQGQSRQCHRTANSLSNKGKQHSRLTGVEVWESGRQHPRARGVRRKNHNSPTKRNNSATFLCVVVTRGRIFGEIIVRLNLWDVCALNVTAFLSSLAFGLVFEFQQVICLAPSIVEYENLQEKYNAWQRPITQSFLYTASFSQAHRTLVASGAHTLSESILPR